MSTTISTDTSTYVTDGGLETDLIFHHGVDLPDFAAFPLVDDADGRALLTSYYAGYADVARGQGVGLMLEAPTWRANPDWAARLGYDAAALDRANRAAIELMHQIRESHADLHDTGVLVTGVVGPRGDGYVPDAVTDADELADYHSGQLASFKTAGADLATVLTLTGPDEALGLVAAARSVGLPIAISFTVETDGRLPDGTTLREAVEKVDAAGGPDYFLVNCAHPTHIAPATAGGRRVARADPWAPTERLDDDARRARRRRGARRGRPGRAARQRPTRCGRRCRTCASWAAVAAPTSGTWRRSGPDPSTRRRPGDESSGLGADPRRGADGGGSGRAL